MNKVRVGIIGGAGYTGGELIRLISHHPACELIFVQSKSSAGKKINEVHKDLFGEVPMSFTNTFQPDIDVLFLCLAHGDSKLFLDRNRIPPTIKIIDLSQDFRPKPGEITEFVYGLPELNKKAISTAKKIANPGCFATAIQLALLPLATNQRLTSEVQVNAITGSTGAGQNLSATTHFSWRDSNISVYKAFSHQHLDEIEQILISLQPDPKPVINFLPFRGNFTRGILATCYYNTDLTESEATDLFQNYYQYHPFVHLTPHNPDVKQAVNTNNCFLYLKKIRGKILIISVIDNLLKGASGQAVQNMNILFGLDETSGLRLKPSAF
jgi:N-acetyl-gamma-glutamyl-phosphate reductase